jgi:hypothetical protein
MHLPSGTAIVTVTAVIPFLAIGGLLWLSRRIERRRSTSIAWQIALTDAIHRELGAAAAPEVRQPWLGGWTVSMAVPLENEATVGTLVRIAHELFATLDRVEAPRLRIVLAPRAQIPARRPARSAGRAGRAGSGAHDHTGDAAHDSGPVRPCMV